MLTRRFLTVPLALTLAAMSSNAASDIPRIGKPRPAPATTPDILPLPPAVIDNNLQIGGDNVKAREVDTRLSVDVRVNERGPYHFVVDSGADTSVVGTRMAQALQLPMGTPVILNGMTGRNIVDRVKVAALTLGPTTVSDLEVPALREIDLGADGLGRLAFSTSGSTVSVAEDAVSPFGFKLASVNSSLTNATVSGPSGSPAALSVNFTGAPNDGDAVTLNFNLPDGTTQNLTLTATTQAPAGANQFTVGATPAATAANFQSALTAAVGGLAATSLKAASTMSASNDFFDGDSSNPPQRVAGPPYDTATGMTAGTAANTVIWYTGEDGAGSARATASARVDPNLVISYGTRANETALRNLVQNVATLAAVTISPSDPNGSGLSTALGQRLSTAMSGSPGVQTISDMETELAGAQASMNSSKSTHQQTSATLTNMLQGITGVSNEQVGAELLTLQNQMAATMQTTALLYQTSLVNYIK